MKNTSVLIFENGADFVAELSQKFGEADDFTVCGTATDGKTALRLIENARADVIVTSLVLGEMDGIGLIDKARQVCPDCLIFVISNIPGDLVVNTVISHGATYYFVKPVSADTVVARVIEMCNVRVQKELPASDGRDKRKSVSLDERISNIFITIGIPPHIKGFAYLREGIKMVVADPAVINKVTKVLYPMIGEKFSTSASKVERAIRHAIEVAWNRGRTDAISSVFGARVYIGNDRPTNSEFIALVADKLFLENLP